MSAPVADSLAKVVGVGAPIAFTAYDGSKAGPPDAEVTLHVINPDALRRAVTAPAELGLARAYVAGDLQVEGDPYTLLTMLARDNVGDLSLTEKAHLLKDLGLRVLRPLAPPAQENRSRLVRLGQRHGKRRDAEAISHHYDVSNRFYEIVLGPSMAYTCAVYPELDSSLEDAQREKVDLICRKLGLRPGMRLLDVGCGWGLMVRHAVREYGVTALGVTLSADQAAWASAAIEREGLAGKAEVRFSDYRDIAETGFDAISSIGLTEHIGHSQIPAYSRALFAKLAPGGRLLNHCITRPGSHVPGIKRNGFISRYVFPDGELPTPGNVVTQLSDAGFEVRHLEDLREHYAMTLRDWSRNLEAGWDEAVSEVGLATTRVWALYMAGSRMAFDKNRIQLHQVLAVKPDEGRSGMPLRPDWGSVSIQLPG
jgi:cyclopropane-fatty-acyl-phospholipid synthase